jgi:4-amino-4-deoxychorismate lyase
MWINGRAGDTVAATDRGLQYGDGLFETIAVRGGEPRLWSRHLERLAAGCRRLDIDCPPGDLLWNECRQEIGNRDRGVVKVLISGGSGVRGYRRPATADPTRVIGCYPLPSYPPQWWRGGVRLRICRTRLGLNPALAGMKHLNRLEQVLARSEWGDPGIAEGLMRDVAGRIVSGTMSNLFLVRGGKLLTPGLARCGIAGVMRGLVIDVAEASGIEVAEGDVRLRELETADGLFLTNSLIGIWPVARIDDWGFDVQAVPQSLRVGVEEQAFGMPAQRFFADADSQIDP